jgi:hypothetical protein
MDQSQVQVSINVNDDIKKGRFANLFQVTRSQTETTLDFIFLHAQTGGDIVARVIVTPEMLQRIAQLLNAEVSQPPITKPDQTKTAQIGFRADSIDDDSPPRKLS